MTTYLNLPLSDKAYNLLTNILQSLLDRSTAQLCPHLWHIMFCCQHSALSCWRILRWHNSNLILLAFTECAVIVPDARDKIWKIRVHKYEREDGEFRVKRNRVLYSHPWFSKEKTGPWRLSDSLKAIPQPYLQYILLFTRIKNNSFQCPQLPKVVCHPRYYLSY